MSERTQELQGIATQNYDDIRALLAGLSEDDLGRKTDAGWDVRRMAGHIAQADGGDTFVTKRLAQGHNADLPGFLSFAIDLANWWGTRKFASASKADLLAELEKQHREFLGYVGGLTDEELDRSGKVMGLGTMSTFGYLKQSPAHSQEHAGAIRRAVVGTATRG